MLIHPDCVENHEALKTRTVVSELAEAIEHQIHNFFADRVVASGEVVGSVLFAGDQLLGVLQLSVGAGSDLVDDGWLQVNLDSSGHVLASSGFAEEGVERVVTSADGLVGWHLSVRLDAVLQAVQLPACISGLNSSLSDMD